MTLENSMNNWKTIAAAVAAAMLAAGAPSLPRPAIPQGRAGLCADDAAGVFVDRLLRRRQCGRRFQRQRRLQQRAGNDRQGGRRGRRPPGRLQLSAVAAVRGRHRKRLHGQRDQDQADRRQRGEPAVLRHRPRPRRRHADGLPPPGLRHRRHGVRPGEGCRRRQDASRLDRGRRRRMGVSAELVSQDRVSLHRSLQGHEKGQPAESRPEIPNRGRRRELSFLSRSSRRGLLRSAARCHAPRDDTRSPAVCRAFGVSSSAQGAERMACPEIDLKLIPNRLI